MAQIKSIKFKYEENNIKYEEYYFNGIPIPKNIEIKDISYNSINSHISKGKQHNDEIPLIPSKEEMCNKINNKDIKLVEVKGKSFKPYKILNIIPFKKRAASTGK